MTLFAQSRIKGKSLRTLSPNKINRIINEIADEILEQSDRILSANATDLSKASSGDPEYPYLQIEQCSLESLSEILRDIASLPSPLGKIISSAKRPNDIIVSKVVVPYGVIGVVYDARPLYIIDSTAICLKSGNSVIFSSNSASYGTSKAIIDIIREILTDNGMDADIATLITPDQQASLLSAVEDVDLIIPRGCSALTRRIKKESMIPVIDTDRGVCHIYIDSAAECEKAASIIHNSKTRSPLACNAVDCLIIHSDKLECLELLCEQLASEEIQIYADERSYEILEGKYPLLEKSTAEHYSTEFTSNKLSIKTVDTIDQALEHIYQHSSMHSESIITEDPEAAKQFTTEVDASCIYHNLPTSFTDGGQFGMGGEIGISTQKIGVRGPISLAELTTYKYVITGNSQIR